MDYMKYSGQDHDCWVEPLTHTEAFKLPSFTASAPSLLVYAV